MTKPAALADTPNGEELHARILAGEGPRPGESPWSAVAWDPETRSLHGLRDPLGEVPLFFAHTETRAGFGIEPSQLLNHMGIQRRPNVRRLASFCLGESDDEPDDFLQEVERVRPGEIVSIGHSGTLRRRYWWHADDPRQPTASTEQARPEDLDRWLIEALEPLRGPVTLALSAGIDSSLVATYLATRADLDVRAVHLGSDRFPSADETDRARELARTLGFPFRRIAIEKHQPDRFSTNEQPLPFPVAALDSALRHAARGTTLVTGIGGDQLFSAGRSHAIRSMVADRRILECVRQIDLRRASDWVAGFRGLLELSPTAAALASLVPPRQLDTVQNREPWMKPAAWIDGNSRPRSTAPLHHTWAWEDVVRNAAIADRLHDVQTLHPFLYPPLWRWAASLPNHLRFRSDRDKWILREHLRARLPGSLGEELAGRPKRQTFNAWAGELLAHPTDVMVAAAHLTETSQLGLTRPTTFHNRFTAFGRVFRAGEVDQATLHTIAIWRTLAAQEWTARLNRES